MKKIWNFLKNSLILLFLLCVCAAGIFTGAAFHISSKQAKTSEKTEPAIADVPKDNGLIDCVSKDGQPSEPAKNASEVENQAVLQQ